MSISETTVAPVKAPVSTEKSSPLNVGCEYAAGKVIVLVRAPVTCPLALVVRVSIAVNVAP